jgi:hypothetical protein
MNLQTRLQRLEQRLERSLVTETATLYFADGTTAMIPCDRDSLSRMYDVALRSDSASPDDVASPEQVKQLDLVRRSVSSKEPGGSLMIELLRSIL